GKDDSRSAGAAIVAHEGLLLRSNVRSASLEQAQLDPQVLVGIAAEGGEQAPEVLERAVEVRVELLVAQDPPRPPLPPRQPAEHLVEAVERAVEAPEERLVLQELSRGSAPFGESGGEIVEPRGQALQVAGEILVAG